MSSGRLVQTCSTGFSRRCPRRQQRQWSCEMPLLRGGLIPPGDQRAPRRKHLHCWQQALPLLRFSRSRVPSGTISSLKSLGRIPTGTCLLSHVSCRVVIAAVVISSREVHSTMSDQGSSVAERHTVQFVTRSVDGLQSQSATYGGQD